MVIEVKGCRDCLFREYGDQNPEDHCRLDGEDQRCIADYHWQKSDKSSPTWCPLKKESVEFKYIV